MEQRFEDARLERQIVECRDELLRLVDAGHRTEARACLDRMTALIRSRSAAQVERMERARGLA